jgi:hypothetical protein
MPNNNLTKNVSTTVLEKFLPSFASNLVLTKTVNREILSGKINNKTGQTVQVKRPHQFKTEKTPDGNLTGKTSSSLTSATATATVDDYITTFVEWTQVEEALELNQLATILNPIAETIATELESRLANFMLANGALSIGVAGSGITKWDEVSRAGSLFTDMGATGKKYAALSPWSIADLAGAQNGIANPSMNKTSWEKAIIPRSFAGLDAAYSSNALATRTTGNFGGTLTVKTPPTVTYVSMKDTYKFSVQLTGATANVTGFLKAGDQLLFSSTAWVNQANKNAIIGSSGGLISFTATVLQDTNSDSSGTVSAYCSGAPIFDTTMPQYNAVNRAIIAGDSVTIRGNKNTLIKPSLFYTDDFVGLATIKLPKLHSIDSSIVSWKGLSIRAHKWSDGTSNTQYMRFDLLPAFCCFNPHKGGQLSGGTGV